MALLNVRASLVPPLGNPTHTLVDLLLLSPPNPSLGQLVDTVAKRWALIDKAYTGGLHSNRSKYGQITLPQNDVDILARLIANNEMLLPGKNQRNVGKKKIIGI